MRRARPAGRLLAPACLLVIVAGCCCAAACRGRGSPGSGAAARNTAGGAATPCRDNAGCPPDAYCVFTPALCGKGPGAGVCRLRSADCPVGFAPVCGCDGQTYDSACFASAAGVDLAARGGCRQAIPGWASCGPHYCDVRSGYCEIYLSDVFELPTTYACRPLPAACRPRADAGTPTCACFPAGTSCLSFCGSLWTGGLPGFHLTCQGRKEPRDAPR